MLTQLNSARRVLGYLTPSKPFGRHLVPLAMSIPSADRMLYIFLLAFQLLKDSYLQQQVLKSSIFGQL